MRSAPAASAWLRSTGASLGLVTACVYPGQRRDGSLSPTPPKVQQSRRLTLELILSNHEKKCLLLCAQRKLRAAEAVPGYGRGNSGKYDGAEDAGNKSMIPPPIWCGTTTNVFCAAAVWRPAENQGMG